MAVLEIRSPKGVCSGCTAPRCVQGGPIDQLGLSGAGCPLESGPSKLADNSNVRAPSYPEKNECTALDILLYFPPPHSEVCLTRSCLTKALTAPAPLLCNGRQCVMCFRCVKECQNGSPEFNLRPPGTDFGLPFFFPVPGTDLPSTFTASPWQAALLALLQGAVLVHHVPLILADLGVPDAAAIAAARFGDGAPFAWHSLVSAALLVLPAALFVTADAVARVLEPKNPFEEAGADAGSASWGERLTRVAYGYLPLVWCSSLAYWSGLGMAEGGTVLPRLAATLGLQSGSFPQVVFGHDAITLVQGTLLVLGVPPTALLTVKLCEENGFGLWRLAAQMMVQAVLVAELWHLIVR